MVYWNLNYNCPNDVPKHILDQFKHYFDSHARRNRYLTGEMIKLLDLLESHGITAAAFKGPVLAATAYGNLSLRQFGDVDIFIQKRCVLEARDLLISQGYSPSLDLSITSERECLQSGYVYPFARDEARIAVELHWAFAPQYFSLQLDTDRLWERLYSASLAGRTVYTFSPEDMLIILCVHGSKHMWERLSWVCDVAELIRSHQDLDWAKVITRASKVGGSRMLYLGLLLSGELLGASLPEDVLQKVESDRAVASLARQVREALYRSCEQSAPPDEPATTEGISAGYVYFHLKARERLQDRAKYCFRLGLLLMTPTARDYCMISLPAFLSPVYYLLRPIRLVREYGASLFKHSCRLLKVILAR